MSREFHYDGSSWLFTLGNGSLYGYNLSMPYTKNIAFLRGTVTSFNSLKTFFKKINRLIYLISL